ncbi:Telomerase Cajal body protein 1 [Lobulomyces angularis]|nr:Telomerase Cajal body protein 1 [Lobulomyces angularis]
MLTYFGTTNSLFHTEKNSKSKELNYIKGTQWSPDGSFLLTNSNDDVIRVFDSSKTCENWENELEIKFGEPIYAIDWYSKMNFADPTSCFFAISKRDHPIKLYDAFTGKLKLSFVGEDHLEQIRAPNSLCFDLDGEKLYTGFDSKLQIYTLSRPGKESENILTTPTKRSKSGQKGIISSISFNPDYSGLLSLGSYSGSVGLYDINDNHRQIQVLKGVGGVTQTLFTLDGNFLFIASRKSSKIQCWDLRNTGELIYSLERPGNTNQRLSFSIDPTGRYLSSGDTKGYIWIYDLKNKGKVVYCQPAHTDVVSSSNFHPTYSMLVSSSGQRRYKDSYNDTVLTYDDGEGGLKYDCRINAWMVQYEENMEE